MKEKKLTDKLETKEEIKNRKVSSLKKIIKIQKEQLRNNEIYLKKLEQGETIC